MLDNRITTRIQTAFLKAREACFKYSRHNLSNFLQTLSLGILHGHLPGESGTRIPVLVKALKDTTRFYENSAPLCLLVQRLLYAGGPNDLSDSELGDLARALKSASKLQFEQTAWLIDIRRGLMERAFTAAESIPKELTILETLLKRALLTTAQQAHLWDNLKNLDSHPYFEFLSYGRFNWDPNKPSFPADFYIRPPNPWVVNDQRFDWPKSKWLIFRTRQPVMCQVNHDKEFSSIPDLPCGHFHIALPITDTPRYVAQVIRGERIPADAGETFIRATSETPLKSYDGHTRRVYAGRIHVHIQGNNVCLGDANRAAYKAMAEGRFLDVLDLLAGVLRKANVPSHYVPVQHFLSGPCTECSESISPTEYMEDLLCSTCLAKSAASTVVTAPPPEPPPITQAETPTPTPIPAPQP